MPGRMSAFFGEMSWGKLAEYPKPLGWVLRFLRILFYIFDEFMKDRCLQTAASLSYTTILSLVPLSAISLAILSRFKFSQETVEKFLMENFLPEAAFKSVIMENIQTFAQNTAALSIIGGLFLAITAVALLNTVEGSFNAIWRVTERRSLLGKFTAFWSIITFSPILLAASFVLTSSIYRVEFVGYLLRHELTRGVVNYALPFSLVFFIIFLAYRILPHTKVKSFPAFIGAIIATVLFSYARWGFGVYVSQYAYFDKIYGILGTLPAFLIWIYISWVIVLFGAEVSFTFQYHRLDPEAKDLPPDEPRYYPYYGIRTVLALDDHFHRGMGPISAVELADRLNVRYEIVEDILHRLMAVQIAASVDDAREQFLPARDLDDLTLKEILEAVHQGNLVTPSWPDDHPRAVLEEIFESARGAVDGVLAHLTLKDVSERIGQRDT